MAIQAVTIGDDGTVLQNVIGLPALTTINGSSVAALGVVTSTSANAIAVGRQGATNPILNVNAATSSVVTGITLVGAAAAAGMAITTTSSGTDEALTMDAKGAGSMTLNGTATGAVKIGHGFGGASNQALSGAGAVNLTTLVTEVTSTGANALTLANGFAGQIKVITMIVDGGDATLTPTTKTGFSTIVFNDIGDGVTLAYTSVGWIVVGNFGCTIS